MKIFITRLLRFGLQPVLILGFLAGGLPSSAQEPEQPPAGEVKAPETVDFPSPVGEVVFPHQMHSEDLGMDCEDCHHPIEAPPLESPHPQYFEQSSIKCQTCHHPADTAPQQQKCASCHDSDSVIPNHELSSKVAIHNLCSGCHEIGTGKEASASCVVCHSGPKSPW